MMTGISSSISSTGISRIIAKPISVAGLTPGKTLLNVGPLSDQQKQVIAERDKLTSELRAAADKAMRESEASKNIESNETYLPNISTLTLDTAKTVLGQIDVAKQMNWIQNTNIHGNNGDQATSSLDTYVSWVKEYIASFDEDGTYNIKVAVSESFNSTEHGDQTVQPSAPLGQEANDSVIREHVILPNVSSLSSATAASVYKQVHNLIDTNQLEGRVLVARNGDSSTLSIDTYLSWLSLKAGINRTV